MSEFEFEPEFPADLRDHSAKHAQAHRRLPQSEDAELGALGSMLLSPREVIGMAIEKRISIDSFHIPAHATVYGVLLELYERDQPIDFIILTQLLRDRGLLEKCGGPHFVTNLFTTVPTASNAGYYLEIIKEKATFRNVILTCNEFAAKGYEEDGDSGQFLDALESRIESIGQSRLQADSCDMRAETMAAVEAIEKLYERGGQISGLATGFTEFDRLTDGLHPSEMIVIAARPSMGKTALAMNIAEHVALDSDLPVGVFSLEMSKQQLIQRMICSRARVNMQALREGYLPDKDFFQMTSSAQQIAKSKMVIDDTSGLSILELRARARKWKRDKDIQLIVIDYLQLAKGSSKRSQDNRQLEISEISAGIKGLAKELAIPIVVLAQLNRKPEDRPGGKPRISDLRESGSIEQDADLVGLLHRSEYYAKDDDKKEQANGEATLSIAKQRNGPVDEVPLTFLKQFARFENRAETPQI